MEPSVVASRCESYRSLFDRRSGLLARYLTRAPLPSPEIIELNLVGPEGQLFDLGALRRLLESAPLCRQIMLVGKSETHPALPSILRTIRDHGVVPSVAFSAPPSSSDLYEALNRFAGFVAVDAGFGNAQPELTRAFRDAGLRVCLNVPVADATLDWLANSLERRAFDHLAHVVALTGRAASGPAAKATGLAAGAALERLTLTATRPHMIRLATDARLGPHLITGDEHHAATAPRCEAARSGLFVDHDLKVTPCSLLPDQVLGSLASESLQRIWQGRATNKYRQEHTAPCPPCAANVPETPPPPESELQGTELEGLELRFGFATSSLCDRSILPLSRTQVLHVLTAVQDWKALRFFVEAEQGPPTQVAASWSSLEYFLSLPPLWGQDLARLHEQLVAGTFEGQETRRSDLR